MNEFIFLFISVIYITSYIFTLFHLHYLNCYQLCLYIVFRNSWTCVHDVVSSTYLLSSSPYSQVLRMILHTICSYFHCLFMLLFIGWSTLCDIFTNTKYRQISSILRYTINSIQYIDWYYVGNELNTKTTHKWFWLFWFAILSFVELIWLLSISFIYYPLCLPFG